MSKPLVTNPNDPKQVEKAEEKAEIREKIRAAAWRAVLSSTDGRQVLQEILNFTGTDRTAACPGSNDLTWIRLGEQNVGFWLKEQIRLFHADAIWQMNTDEKKRMEG